MVPLFNRSLHDQLNGVAIAPAAMETLEAQRGKLAAIEMSPRVDSRSREAAEQAIAQAFVTGFRWIMLVSAVLAIAGAASAWILVGRPRRRTGESPPA
jgi:hypothetical protein